MLKGNFTHTIGRRKNAIARIFAMPGTGKITVNERPLEDYFGRKVLQMVVNQPLKLVDAVEKYDLKITVNGGGLSGQAGAVRLGIARMLQTVDPELRKEIKAAGFLTRDPRAVERKKYGLHKARRRPQFSKR